MESSKVYKKIALDIINTNLDSLRHLLRINLLYEGDDIHDILQVGTIIRNIRVEVENKLSICVENKWIN